MQKENISLKKRKHNIIILTKEGLNERKNKNKKNINNTVNSCTLLTLKGEDFTIKMNLINTNEINKEKILKTVISMKKHLIDSEGESINIINNNKKKIDKKSFNSYFKNQNILIESNDNEKKSDYDLVFKFNEKLNINKNSSEAKIKGSEHTIKQSCRAIICKTNSEIDKYTELDKKNIKDLSKYGFKSNLNECEIIGNNNISVYENNNNINNENNKIKDSSIIYNDSNYCRIISYSNKKNNILNSNIYNISNLENNKKNDNINSGNNIKLKNNYLNSQTSLNDIAKIKSSISQSSLPLKKNIKNIYNENENIADNISENKKLIIIKKIKKFNNPINLDQNKNIKSMQILNNKEKPHKQESKFSNKHNSTNLLEENNNRIVHIQIDENRRLKCLICEKLFKINKIFAPRCEIHLMCRKCIKSYYEENIENNNFLLKCPFTKCKEDIDFEILKTIISPIHCEMIITHQKKPKDNSNIYNLNNNSISNSIGKELILKDTKLIFNTKIKSENLKLYSQNHVIDINSNEKLYMYNKNKDIYCQKCLNPTLFTKINGYFIKCLNCQYRLCKYCLREFTDFHMDIMSANHCKVYYRKDDYYFDNPHIILKYLLQLFFVFSIFYLMFAGFFYIILDILKKFIKLTIHNRFLLIIFICFAYLFSFVALLVCSPFLIVIHPFFPAILSLVDY